MDNWLYKIAEGTTGPSFDSFEEEFRERFINSASTDDMIGADIEYEVMMIDTMEDQNVNFSKDEIKVLLDRAKEKLDRAQKKFDVVKSYYDSKK